MTLEAETAATQPPRNKGGRPRKDRTTGPNAAVDQQLENIGAEVAPPGDLSEIEPDLGAGVDAAAESGESSIGIEEVQPPTRTMRAPAVAPADAPGADDALNPFRRDPLPPPRETKVQAREARREVTQSKQTQTQTPSKKRFGVLGEKIPGAEHVKVHKRLDNGGLAYIGEYNVNDLAQSQNIESFLNRYIKPSYGPGEYQITGVNAAGQEFDGGIVQLMNPLSSPDVPPPSAAAANPLALIQQMLDREANRRDGELRMLANDKKDPIVMLKEMIELQQTLAPPMPQLKPSDGGNNNAMNTLLAGMMQMMGTVLTVALQPKGQDPIMMAILAKLLDDKTKPGVDPTQQLVALSEVAKNLAGNGGGGGSNQLVELLLRERMSPSDVMNLVQQVKSERGTDGLKKSMEDIGIMLQAVNQLRAHTEPGTASGFWEAVTAVLGNQHLASAIGSRVRSNAPQVAPLLTQQPQQLPPQPQPRMLPNDPLAMKAREIAARRLRLEEIEIQKREAALGIGAPTPVVTPVPAPATHMNQQVSAEEVQRISDAATQSGQKNTLPPNIAEYINNYIEAKDDGDIIETTMLMIESLAKDEQWKPYSEVIVSYILQSDRGKFLQYMASFFVSMRTIGLIEDALARKIMDALHNNFDTVVAVVHERQAAGGPGAEEEEEQEGEEDQGDEEEDTEDEDVLGIET